MFTIEEMNDKINKKNRTTNKIIYSVGENDECYTPSWAVKAILEYIPKEAIIWCPFDTVKSKFVQIIQKTNKVIFSHIENGENFYTHEPKEHWDIIISNPPFSNKKEIFERAFSFNKPFALIMSVTWLNDSSPKILWKKHNSDMQLMLFDERMRFYAPNGEKMGSPTFGSAYFCRDFLPKQIVLYEEKSSLF